MDKICKIMQTKYKGVTCKESQAIAEAKKEEER